MNEELIEQWANEVWSAGDTYIGPSTASLTEFARRVAAHQKELDAKICEHADHDGVMIALECAAAIRKGEWNENT